MRSCNHVICAFKINKCYFKMNLFDFFLIFYDKTSYRLGISGISPTLSCILLLKAELFQTLIYNILKSRNYFFKNHDECSMNYDEILAIEPSVFNIKWRFNKDLIGIGYLNYVLLAVFFWGGAFFFCKFNV